LKEVLCRHIIKEPPTLTLIAEAAKIDGLFMIPIISTAVVRSEESARSDGSKMSVVTVASESVSGPAFVRMMPDAFV
jgi:hypothetical protein